MKKLDKLLAAKKKYDEMETIRSNASKLFDNEKYMVIVHFHYQDKIVLSIKYKDDISIQAQIASFEIDTTDNSVSIQNRGNHCDADINAMLDFIKEWMQE